MHEAFADRICSSLQGAMRELPFGPGMVVWTIEGHMFAAYTEYGAGLSLRVAEFDVVRVAAVHGTGEPGLHTGAGWVVIPWYTRPEILRRRIAQSYDLVRADGNGPFLQN